MRILSRLLILSYVMLASPAIASNINYIQNVTPDKASELVAKGDELLRALYGGQDISSIDAISIITEGTFKKNRFSLKGKDLSILLKRSKGSEEEKSLRRDMLAQILAIVWKVYEVGGVRDVSSISYKVVDPDHKLYKYLMTYVDVASPQASVFAYDRDPGKNKSSHYKEVSPEGQWGLDVRFFANQASLPLLPMNKKHILFGKLGFGGNQPPLLFLKIEDAGIAAPSEVISHGLSFLKTKMRSKEELSATRSEKYVPTEAVNAYSTLIEQLSPDEKTQFDVEAVGAIRDMVLKADQIVATRADLKTQYDAFMATLQQLFPNDGENVRWRTGNEIIMDLSRL